jgi:hypothetical protein
VNNGAPATTAARINYCIGGGGQIPGCPGQGADGTSELAPIFFVTEWAAVERDIPARTAAATAEPAAIIMNLLLGENFPSRGDVMYVGPE